MKRITTLLVAAIFMISGAVVGHAESNIDVKVQGQWDFVFGWADNIQHWKKGSRHDDNGIAAQRIRTQINFIASENLQGVLQFEIGDIHWGNNNGNGSVGRGSGGSVSADGVNIETKHAYLDWMVPTTDLHIRMGLQGLALPMATGLGNPIFDDDVAGVVANYKFDDTFSLTAFWIRPYNAYINDSEEGNVDWGTRSIDDETDMFGLIAPISLDGITITPWGMWANIGDGSGFHTGLFREDSLDRTIGANADGMANEFRAKNDERTTAWWAGLGVAVDLWDPLTFAVDGMYGHMQAANFETREITSAAGAPITYGDWTDTRIGTEGWFVAAALDYKLDWGTPGIFGWYASGDDYDDVKDDGMLGRLPVMSSSTGWSPTSFGFDGGFGISTDQVVGASGTGMWGIGIQVADMSFIEDLTHTIRFVYMQGTNDADIIKKGQVNNDAFLLPYADDFYLTDEDQAFEINFDHKYQVYENLAAVLELGYIKFDLDRSTWKNYDGEFGRGHKTDDAWKAQLSFQYKF